MNLLEFLIYNFNKQNFDRYKKINYCDECNKTSTSTVNTLKATEVFPDSLLKSSSRVILDDVKSSSTKKSNYSKFFVAKVEEEAKQHLPDKSSNKHTNNANASMRSKVASSVSNLINSNSSLINSNSGLTSQGLLNIKPSKNNVNKSNNNNNNNNKNHDFGGFTADYMLKSNPVFSTYFYMLILIFIILCFGVIFVNLLISSHFRSSIIIKDFFKNCIEISYSQLELGLILLVNNLKYSKSKFIPLYKEGNEMDYFKTRIDYYTSIKNDLLFILQNKDNYNIQESINYQNTLFSERACESIELTYHKYVNDQLSKENGNCSDIASGIFEKGFYLGYDTLMNSLSQIIIEDIKIDSETFHLNLDLIISAQKDIIEKNIKNIRLLRKIDSDKTFEEERLSITNFQIMLIFFMIILLIFQFCNNYLLNKRLLTITLGKKLLENIIYNS